MMVEMNRTISFRMLEEKDLDEIVKLENICFTLPWSKEAFYNELHQNKYAHYIVLENEDQIIGYCGAWLVIDEGHITNIAVLPGFRGNGYGEALMVEMMKQSKERGIERITLEARVSNTVAIALYKKLGFIEGAIRKNYYSDNQEDAIVLWVNIV